MTRTKEAEADVEGGDRLAGIVLIGAAAASLFAMAHHPVDARAAVAGGIVHGALIALSGATAFGFAHFSIRRGLHRPLVLAAFVAYGIALFGHVGAATINGFAVPGLVAKLGPAGSQGLIPLAWQLNQALARLGVIANGIAFCLWSADLIASKDRLSRMTGAAGLAAGGVPAALLIAGAMNMALTGAMLAYAIQNAWTALLGAYLVRHGARG